MLTHLSHNTFQKYHKWSINTQKWHLNFYFFFNLSWPYCFTKGYPHNEEPWPHLELDSCQCPFPWLDIPCLAESWHYTWDYSTLIRLPLLASPSSTSLTLQVAGAGKLYCPTLCPGLSLLSLDWLHACPLVTVYCTPKQFNILVCNFSKLLNSGYSMSLHLWS